MVAGAAGVGFAFVLILLGDVNDLLIEPGVAKPVGGRERSEDVVVVVAVGGGVV